jgi:hypothetical protein
MLSPIVTPAATLAFEAAAQAPFDVFFNRPAATSQLSEPIDQS